MANWYRVETAVRLSGVSASTMMVSWKTHCKVCYKWYYPFTAPSMLSNEGQAT